MSDQGAPSLDAMLADLRARGWVVAVHNDYRLLGTHHTFWLFTRDGIALKGEGLSDVEAVAQVRAQVEALGAPPSEKTTYQDDGEALTQRVYDAFLSTFSDAEAHMPALSHYLPRVFTRWSHNLRVALRGGNDFWSR